MICPRLSLALLFVGFLLPAASFAKTTVGSVTFHDVQELMAEDEITETEYHPVGIAVDTSGLHRAYVLTNDARSRYKVYLGGKKMYEGAGGLCFKQNRDFRVTDDGHVLYSPNCATLYADESPIVTSTNVSSGAGYDSANGKVFFTHGDTVKAYDLKTKKTAETSACCSMGNSRAAPSPSARARRPTPTKQHQIFTVSFSRAAKRTCTISISRPGAGKCSRTALLSSAIVRTTYLSFARTQMELWRSMA